MLDANTHIGFKAKPLGVDIVISGFGIKKASFSRFTLALLLKRTVTGNEESISPDRSPKVVRNCTERSKGLSGLEGCGLLTANVLKLFNICPRNTTGV